MLLATLFAVAAAQVAMPDSTPSVVVAMPSESEPRRIRTPEMVADFYLPAASRPVPAILLLGGSEGGLSNGGAREARLLAERGYAVLHLSYFGSPGQPATLKMIPVETFDRALDWLKAQAEVAGDRIGVIGTSKGAEAALLVASRRSDIRITVLGVPSSVTWPGIDNANLVTEASWSENGKPVPFVPYGWTGEWKGIHALYADGLNDAAAVERASIPAERVNGPIVMVCGERDSLWPSCPMSQAIQERLRTRSFTHPVTLLSYPEAGHAAFGPPVEASAQNAAMLSFFGGTSAGTTAARTDSWPKVLAAIDAALKRSTAR